MSKTLTSVLEIVAGAALVVSGYGAGFGVALIGAGVAGLLTKIPKPPQTYETVKTERPPRFSAYAVNRLVPIIIPHI